VEAATLGDTEEDPSAAERCEPTGDPGFVAHPPLGKWAIAIGLRLFGTDELGWRIAAAVAGTLTVLVLVRVTRRMTGSTVLGCLAGLLLALDGLHFVQSRVAMLDVFLVAWVVGAFACLVADRDAVRRRLAAAPDLGGGDRGLGLRPWRLAAGLCLGAALATKWSAVYYLAVLVPAGLRLGGRRPAHAGVPAPARATVLRSAAPALAALVVLPVASTSPRGPAGSSPTGRTPRLGPRLGGRPPGQRAGVRGAGPAAVAVAVPRRAVPLPRRPAHRAQLRLAPGQLAAARPAGLLLLPGGPRAGEYGCTVERCAREVLALGTPAIWWAAIPMLVGLLWLWVAKRDWRAGATLLLALTAIVPWIRDDLDGRTMFLFYALPGLPFLCLGLALVAGWAIGGAGASLRRRRAGSRWPQSTCRWWW
jgi:hypothetical protein